MHTATTEGARCDQHETLRNTAPNAHKQKSDTRGGINAKNANTNTGQNETDGYGCAARTHGVKKKEKESRARAFFFLRAWSTKGAGVQKRTKQTCQAGKPGRHFASARQSLRLAWPPMPGRFAVQAVPLPAYDGMRRHAHAQVGYSAGLHSVR